MRATGLRLVSFMLVTDEKGSIFHIDRDEPLRKRNLYTMVLDLVPDIERRHHAL